MQKENLSSTNEKKNANRWENNSLFYTSEELPSNYIRFANDEANYFKIPSFKLFVKAIKEWWLEWLRYIYSTCYAWLRSLPWLKIGILTMVAYAIIIKDLQFSVNFSSPEEILPDDRKHEETLQLGGAAGIAQPTKKAINPQAPVTFSAFDKRAMDYVDRFGKTAIQEMKKFGIPASITLAQGLIESNAGNSNLAKRNNNHFGIKCFSKNCPKGHCSNFSDDHHKDFFRKFSSAWESYRAHSNLLANGRYKVLQKHGKDYKKWAAGLKHLGYATDSHYDKKLIDTIEKFQLHRFDSY